MLYINSNLFSYSNENPCIHVRYVFHYVNGAFGWEIVIAIFTSIIDFTRQELATHGNKMGNVNLLLWSIGLSVPIVVGQCFFLRLQSYVLKLDVILNTSGIVYLSLQLLISITLVVSYFLKNGNSYKLSFAAASATAARIKEKFCETISKFFVLIPPPPPRNNQ